MDKKAAKEQFNRLTKKLGIVHTFSFDEAWEWLEYKRNHIFMNILLVNYYLFKQTF